jgi:ATP-binding cassette subfamily B protein
MVADSITNVFNLFAFATKGRERKKISDYYKDSHIPKRLSYHKLDFYSCILTSSLDVILVLSLSFYIIILSQKGKIDLGSVVFIITTVNLFLDNIWRAFNESKEFIQKYSSTKASFAIMQIPHESVDSADAKDLTIKTGSVQFKDVSFFYQENVVFDKLNLKIPSGQKIGIVGGSGVGKSTLANLMMKNFAIQGGQILVDEQDILKIKSDSLRKNIIYIPQEVILFHRSIGENIGYAKENCTLDEIKDAAKRASLDLFIDSLCKKYQTIVGERGVKLSGGQRQRIAIARAFLKSAPILILDEATSALDSTTEKEIQKSLWELMKGKTCIVIAHRLSTLIDMDRILVLNDGKIAQDGSHQELLSKEGIYKNLWENQIKLKNE